MIRVSRFAMGVVLLGALVLSACGREVRSAAAEDEAPVVATVQNEPDPASDLAQGVTTEPDAAAIEEEPVVERREPAPPPPVRRSTVPPSSTPTHAPREEAPVLTATDPEGSRVEFEEEPVLQIESGTRVGLQTETELSTEHQQVGDVFWATVADDVLGENGLVLLAAGTRVRGRVLESTPSPSAEEPATLGIGFEAVFVDGVELPLDAEVISAAMERGTRDSGGESAAKVAGGAAAGAILGRILGGKGKDAVKGAVVGAAAGAAVAAGTRGGHAKLPAGAIVEIELRRPVRLVS